MRRLPGLACAASLACCFTASSIAPCARASDGSAGSGAVGDATFDIETIRTAWRQREDTVRSIRFEVSQSQFKTAEFLAPESLRNHYRIMGHHQPPHEDQTFTETMTVTFAGGFSRIEFVRPDWHGPQGKFLPRRTVDAYDEETCVMFTESGSVERRMSAFIHQDVTMNRNVKTLPVAALVAYYRPFHAMAGRFRESNLSLTERRGVVDGRTCLILHHAASRGGRWQEIWVDPARDFAPLRMVEHGTEQVLFQWTIRYQGDARHGPVPSAWQALWFGNDGEVRTSWDAEVTQYAINEPIPREHFQIEFPPGTMVTDIVGGDAKRNYIIRANGSERTVLQEEGLGGATRAEMMVTNTGDLLRPARPDWWRWLTWASLLVLVLAVGMLVWRSIAAQRAN